MKIAKLMVAFLAAAATPALMATVYLIGFNGAFIFPADYFSVFRSVFLPVFWVALMHTLLLGVPVFIILSWRGLIHWQSILISAFIIGALPLTLLGVILLSQLHAEATIFFGLMGVSGGIAFWLLWRYWIRAHR